MADYLRYTRPGAANPQRSRMPSYVAGLDELEDDDFPVAPPNLSGRTERDVPIEPETPNEEGGQQFQLGQPDMVPDLTSAPRGDLRLPGDLAAPRQQLRPPMQGDSRLSFVQGLEPSPEAEEPMPGQKGGGYDPSLTQRALMASEDRSDREASDRARRARIGIAIAGGLGGIFGDTTQAQVAQAAAANDPNAPFEARRASRAAEAEAQAAAAQQQYDREFAQQRLGLDERRIAQGEAATQQRAGYRDADIMADHPNAENERQLYTSAFGALPQHIRETFPGFDPSDPNVQRTLGGLGAAQVRRNLDLLMDQVKVRFPDEGDWRSTVRTGGGRQARGGLAGLSGGGGRTVRRGDSGVTPEQLLQMDAAGVDEMPVDAQPQAPAQGAPLARPTPRQGAGGQRPQAGAQAPGAAIPPGWVQPGAQAAPQGRPLIDRPMTQDELATATPQIRRTQLLAEAQMREWATSDPARWRDAVAAVEGYRDARRDSLMAEFGSDTANRFPGWRRVRQVPGVTPAQYGEAREAVVQANNVRANARRIQEIAQQVNALNLAEDAFRGHPLVTEWRSLARRIQTALRVIDRTGVPTGDEQVRAMQEAPEPDGINSLMRASATYSTLPDALSRNLWQYMDGIGYRPETGAPRAPQGGQ